MSVRDSDHFSFGLLAYALCVFLAYKTLYQLSYVNEYSSYRDLGTVLIALHVVGLIWCLAVCLWRLWWRQTAAFLCAFFLVAGLESVSPDPMRVHFLLHRNQYLARVAGTLPS